MAIGELRKEINHYCELGERVIDQARRRVPDGEQVPNDEKVYSIFEPHTDLIKRGKAQTQSEFGHKVFLAESAQGLMNGKTSEMWSCHQSTPFHRGFVINNSTFESVRVIQAI